MKPIKAGTLNPKVDALALNSPVLHLRSAVVFKMRTFVILLLVVLSIVASSVRADCDEQVTERANQCVRDAGQRQMKKISQAGSMEEYQVGWCFKHISIEDTVVLLY